MNLNNSSTTAFACEVFKQVFTWSILGFTENLKSTFLEVTGKTSSRAHLAYTLVCLHIHCLEEISEELSCHWDIKYWKAIFKNAYLLPILIMPLALFLNSSRNFAYKEALHSDHVSISILKIYPRTVDVSQFIVLKVTFIPVLQRVEYCIWQGPLLLNIHPRC